MAVPPADDPSGSPPAGQPKPGEPPSSPAPGAPTSTTDADPAQADGSDEPDRGAADADPPPASAPTERGGLKAARAAALADDIYRVSLDVFEGPLDLLLHLIQKHELDIFDIPISFITKKYLEYLDWMRKLQIDVASEYLVMAATLAYIKSRMLLPDPPSELDEEEAAEAEDPRGELVRRLLEYQKYKDVAQKLSDRSLLDRDVFERGTAEPEPHGPAPFAPVSVFKLFEAFDDVLRRAKRTAEHEVIFERISLAERIVELTELLHDRGRMRFEELFEAPEPTGGERHEPPTGFSLVVTFLALLEMARLGVARVVQEQALEELYVEFAKRDAALRPKTPPTPEPAAAQPHEAPAPTSMATGEPSVPDRPSPRGEPLAPEPAGDDAGPDAEPPPADDTVTESQR